jgi:hypothetical protein
MFKSLNFKFTFSTIKYVFISAFFCLSSFIYGARAEDECPPEISSHYPIQKQMTYKDVNLSDLYYHNILGVWVRMPVGYKNLIGLGGPNVLKNLYKTKPLKPVEETTLGIGYGSTFWMPSLRWFERDRENVFGDRPCENGRPRPTQDEYLVDVGILWPWKADYLEHNTPPSQILKNVIELKIVVNTKPNAWGLIEGVDNGKKLSGSIYNIYFTDFGSEPEAYLRCSPDTPTPSCIGEIYYKKDNLAFRIRFPEDRLFEWKKIVDTTKKLLEQWRDAGAK